MGDEDNENNQIINYDPAERELGLKYLESGNKIETEADGSREIIYSFDSGDFTGLAQNEEDRKNFLKSQSDPLDHPAEREMQRDVFCNISSISSVTFKEFDPDQDFAANLLCTKASWVGGAMFVRGWGTQPRSEDPHAQQTLMYGSSYLKNLHKTNADPIEKDQAINTGFHETGHILGLAHPHDGKHTLKAPEKLEAEERTSENIHLSETYYTYRSSVMIYDSDACDIPSSFMPWDIAKIQEKYGINTSHNSEDDAYTIDPAEHRLYTIWDGNGDDTIDASASTEPVRITLWEGVTQDAQTQIGNQKIHLAYGANIENATGGSENDVLIGNALSNELTGNSGNDRFQFQNPTGSTNHLGHDRIKDFTTGRKSDEKDAIIVGPDVENVRAYRNKGNAVLIFEDKNGKTIPGTSVALENFYETGLMGRRNFRKQIENLTIAKTDENGDEHTLSQENIQIEKSNALLMRQISEKSEQLEDIPTGTLKHKFIHNTEPVLAPKNPPDAPNPCCEIPSLKTQTSLTPEI